MHLIVDSSMESEAVATGKCGELVTYAREILRAFGILPIGPTFVGSDNKANAMIAAGTALPSRSRHCLRRYLTFLQRLRRGEVEVGFVPDTENPADFLTKWVGKSKAFASIAFATNYSNVVLPSGVTSEINTMPPLATARDSIGRRADAHPVTAVTPSKSGVSKGEIVRSSPALVNSRQNSAPVP